MGVKADQGSAYRGQLKNVLPHIEDIYRTDEDGHRSHMGASVLGEECGRAVWYDFRWCTRSNFDGRMLRLFNRGHMEEARFIALLLMINCPVYQQDAEGHQYRIHFADHHGGGSGDGIVVNLPDLEPGMPALLEAKTHNEKSFRELAGKSWKDFSNHAIDPEKYPKKVAFDGKGVRDAKIGHYIQANLYMRKMGLSVCLYMAVNKDTDELYLELIPANPETADRFIDRGEQLVWMEKPPEKINKSPGFWKCRFCDHRPVCHLGEDPDRNCRTCEFSRPASNGNWHCSAHNEILGKEKQLVGCEDYKLKPGYR